MADTATERKGKPDQSVFDAQLSKLQKEHEGLMKKLNDVKGKLDLAKPASNDPSVPQSATQKRNAELRKELGEIRAVQSSKKSSKQTLLDRQKAIQESINSKINAQKIARANNPYKSVAEIDAEIARLDSRVESGTLKLVEERKTLDTISQLRKQKKGFSQFDEIQANIDKEKASLVEVRKQLDDPEAKKLSDRFTEITKELDTIKAEQDGVYKNLSALRDERTALQQAQQEKYGEIKALKDAFYQEKRQAREKEQAAFLARKQRQKEEREAYDREKKLKVANQLLEDASFKAYSSEIKTCENLIAYFDPDSAEKKVEVGGSKFAASVGRTVTAEPKGMKVLKKEEEDYFIGGGGKKKGKKGGSKAEAKPANISLSIGVIEELSKVGVDAPSSQEDVPAVVQKLKEKLQHYKDNQEEQTTKNIAKAKADIAKLEQADKLEDAIADLNVEETA